MAAADFAIRLGNTGDAETIVAHRRAMFREMGYRDEQALDKMCDGFLPWLEQKMQVGEYLAWFAVDSRGDIAAGLGLWTMDWPPNMIGAGRWWGNILNVYTRPESRRNGLARRLVENALEWCRAKGVATVVLHASDAGRPLYESLGFRSSTEMRIVLQLDSPGTSGPA